jgi:peptidoglycan/LPS O-acetylase OafA/YrhL
MSTNITWSVAIEEQFYLLWPLLFCLLPRRAFKFVFPTVILLSTGFRALHNTDGAVLYFHSLSVISDMAIGGGVAYLSLSSDRFLGALRKLSPGTIATIYLAAVPLLIWSQSLINISVTFSRLIIAGFFAFVILTQNFSVRSRLKIGRLKGVTRLGVYTYGLYLLHASVLSISEGFLRRRPALTSNTLAAFGVGGIELAVTLFIAWASYRLYEERFLRLKRRFAHIAST